MLSVYIRWLGCPGRSALVIAGVFDSAGRRAEIKNQSAPKATSSCGPTAQLPRLGRAWRVAADRRATWSTSTGQRA